MGNAPPVPAALFTGSEATPAGRWSRVFSEHRALLPLFLPLPPGCPATHPEVLQTALQNPDVVRMIQLNGYPSQDVVLGSLHDRACKPPGTDGVWLATLRLGDPTALLPLLKPPVSPQNLKVAADLHPMVASLLAAAGPPPDWVLQQIVKERSARAQVANALKPKSYAYGSEEFSLSEAVILSRQLLFDDHQVIPTLINDGFVKVPGLIPDKLIRAARQHINFNLGVITRPVSAENHGGSTAAAVAEARKAISSAKALTDIFNSSLLGPVCALLMGDEGGTLEQHHTQVALRYPGDFCIQHNGSRERCDPGTWDGHVAAVESHWHFDGCATEEHNHYGEIHNFTILVGVLLGDVPEPLSGELMCHPTSHYALADYFGGGDAEFPKRLVALRDKGSKELPTGPRSSDAFPGRFGVPQRPRHCTGKAGDVFLANFLTAHGIAPNASPDIRYAIYFRVTTKARQQRPPSPEYLQGKSANDAAGRTRYHPEAMLDPWLEWRGLHAHPTILRFPIPTPAPHPDELRFQQDLARALEASRTEK